MWNNNTPLNVQAHYPAGYNAATWAARNYFATVTVPLEMMMIESQLVHFKPEAGKSYSALILGYDASSAGAGPQGSNAPWSAGAGQDWRNALSNLTGNGGNGGLTGWVDVTVTGLLP